MDAFVASIVAPSWKLSTTTDPLGPDAASNVSSVAPPTSTPPPIAATRSAPTDEYVPPSATLVAAAIVSGPSAACTEPTSSETDVPASTEVAAPETVGLIPD